MRVLRGVVYMTKSSGPRTEPWGTPQEEVCLYVLKFLSKLIYEKKNSLNRVTVILNKSALYALYLYLRRNRLVDRRSISY